MSDHESQAASPRDEYYAELETLEPDAKMRAAIAAARTSPSQRTLLEAWSRKASAAPRHRSA
jgi:hypothetical protein